MENLEERLGEKEHTVKSLNRVPEGDGKNEEEAIFKE